ncbi:hypothetical protein PVL29_022961 [Vitis rotundifolia]|uniref:Uncharacterized protein n=1 Tax=Vitis rotundifolia TaxID=103349 RepID=A0AA38YWY4_VITRO|nr:hypothetical protein PVL29_022961 [Vitis rotundifolia]
MKFSHFKDSGQAPKAVKFSLLENDGMSEDEFDIEWSDERPAGDGCLGPVWQGPHSCMATFGMQSIATCHPLVSSSFDIETLF